MREYYEGDIVRISSQAEGCENQEFYPKNTNGEIKKINDHQSVIVLWEGQEISWYVLKSDVKLVRRGE